MPDPFIIASVPVEMIDTVYPDVEGMVSRVIDKAPNEINMEVVKDQLKRGETLLIAIVDNKDIIAINILQIKEFETGHKVLYIPITAGDRMGEWLSQFLDMAHQYAKENGCHEIRGLSCRKGWSKVLKEHKWYDIHTVIGCEVK